MNIALLLIFFFFFFNDTATTEIYTLSLHDALPISPATLRQGPVPNAQAESGAAKPNVAAAGATSPAVPAPLAPVAGTFIGVNQSESNFIPPDSTMAAGPTQIVVATNGRIKAFGNDGTLVAGSSMSLGQFFSTLPGAAD